MFRNKVSQQYIGKSKLTFKYHTQNHEFPIKGEVLIGNIANRLFIPGSEKVIPDYFLSGILFPGDQPVFRINFNLDKIGPKYNDILYITGIPKGINSLDPFRLQNKKWSSYYEDEHGGYLFQILNYTESLKFINHGTDKQEYL